MQLAQTVKAALKKDFEQQKKYYDYIRTSRPELASGFDGQEGESPRNDYFMHQFELLIKRYEPETAKPSTEQPTNIVNPPRLGDTTKKPDSGNHK